MKFIDGVKFSEMVKLGAHHLYENADYVDSLNVFPVPDGDTGTNMNLSMSSGAKEIEAHTSHISEKRLKLFQKAYLMGARGNSGVIFRNYSVVLEKRLKKRKQSMVSNLRKH